MAIRFERQQTILHHPVGIVGRVLLVVSIVPLLLALRLPLWSMSFQSNQYPDPLRLTIRIDRIEGQKTALRDDLREINSLNHYIGMRPLAERDFSEFVWMPFVLGFFILLALRSAVLGIFRDLVDELVLFTYFGAFSFYAFYNRLWEYGHVLAPDAPIKVEPFMPPLFGRLKVANFWVESYPGPASYMLGVFGLLLAAALALTLRAAIKARRAASTT